MKKLICISYLFLLANGVKGQTLTNISIPQLLNNGVPTTQFCAISPGGTWSIITINYTTTGTANPGNIFTFDLVRFTGSNWTTVATLSSPAGVSGGTTGGQIPNVVSGNNYQVRVTSSNPVIVGYSAIFTIGGNMPYPASPIGPATVCAGTDSVLYYIHPVTNALSYYWNLPPGLSLLAVGDTTALVRFLYTASTGSVWATAYAYGCTSHGYPLSVTVNCVGSACYQPTARSTTSITTSTATFNWTGIPTASGYNIRYRITGVPAWTTINTSSSPYVATGLTDGSNYEWQIETACPGGGSGYTSSLNFTTIPVNCVLPSSFSTTNITSSSATFNWSAVGGANLYGVQYRLVGAPAWTTAVTGNTFFLINTLASNSNYEWQVRTNCIGGGVSPYSASVLFTTPVPPCNVPVNSSTTNITATTATFNYFGTSTGTIGFMVRYRETGSAIWTNAADSLTPYTATGLIPNTSYEWQVQRLCSQGQSSFTNSVIFITPCVNPAATITYSGSTTLCAGDSLLLTATAGQGYTYKWLLNGNQIPGMTLMTYKASGSGNYAVVITSGTCSATSSPLTITINPLPAVSFTGLAASYFTNSPSATLTGNPSGGTFSGPGISGNMFNPATAGAGGPYNIQYVYTNGSGCSNTAIQQTTVNCTVPVQPGTISQTGGTTKVCPGDIKTYKVPVVSGAVSYNWIPPSGAVISSGQGTTTVNVTYLPGFVASGILSVQAVNTCGSGPLQTKNITINTPVKPGNISGQAAGLCNATGVSYSVAFVDGMVYNWSFLNGTAFVTSGQGNATITSDFTGGFSSDTLKVTASNGCGISSARTLYVKAIPAVPGSITGAAGVCANQSGVPYSIATISGSATYTWNGPSGSRFSDGITTSTNATFTTASNSVTVKFASTGGSIKVKANNNCGSSSFKTKTVSIVCREAAGSNSLEWQAFPNPVSSGQLTIQLNRTKGEQYEIYLTDLTGRKLSAVNGLADYGRTEVKMDVSDLIPGIYLLELHVNSRTVNKKIIIE
jgi:hypothetical protein